MTWEVQFAPSAVRGLDRLPPRIVGAVVEFITVTLPTNPERMSKPLAGELEGYRSARRGDYRVIFSLDDATSELLVIRVAHRADVYRPG
ncbi:type II toxin-antitoxin system RelE/ParE family toxin [Ruania alkalisoli]|uniref:Type II toxin-antitoxin system RelE/ParE family toxin n=1 Tax=Ruania alkalisoli TaxID=2779775 RepID=A0A7M1SPW8_9MICO|nr:type II toxin-antitoxin system RelE/ParE family toxin [Ruania alkalisoli]QOR69599.1 type II toxin-antitoxin system RelE/ParE family toxin [Ruania alkalisoli]